MNLINFKRNFDPLLFDFINKKINQIPNEDNFKFLKDQFNYLIEFIDDGKRVRPFISYLIYFSYNKKNNKEILELLVFLELFHNFCLIHDDIMDNSPTRHGKKTIHNKYDVPNAILLGDYLHSWSWEIINNCKLNNNVSKKLINLLSEMTEEVFLGQAIDLNLNSNRKISNEIIFKKTLLKTAGYTFIFPMLVGLALSGKDNKKNKNILIKLGENLGLAFQIQDDLLDITSDFNKKKKPLSDIQEGKHTILTNFVFEKGNSFQKEKLSKVFGKEIKDRKEIQSLFYNSGAVSYGENLINEYYNNAIKIAENKNDILEFIDLLKNRKY